MSVVGGVGFVVEPVVQAFEGGAAEVVRGVESVGRPEMGQEGFVVEFAVPVRGRLVLGRFYPVLGKFRFVVWLLHTSVCTRRTGRDMPV